MHHLTCSSEFETVLTHQLIDPTFSSICSLQFETEAEGSRLRRDVTVQGGVAPVGSTRSERVGLQSIHSGREEMFAFRRAVSLALTLLLLLDRQI
jgi:hypothetical protein